MSIIHGNGLTGSANGYISASPDDVLSKAQPEGLCLEQRRRWSPNFSRLGGPWRKGQQGEAGQGGGGALRDASSSHVRAGEGRSQGQGEEPPFEGVRHEPEGYAKEESS